ncbi:metal-sensing transcriptional repressor, partial [Streptomonospora algeriensis]
MVGDALIRLRRARGPHSGVITMIGDGEDCAAALTRLAAVPR